MLNSMTDYFQVLPNFESLSFDVSSGPVDFQRTLFQALINEGKHMRILNAEKLPFRYSEKSLREEAAAEIARVTTGFEDEGKDSKKRKILNDDEKTQQSRDRNKEHAKNTRLRKKAYLAKLKELVDRITDQKLVEDREHLSLGMRIHNTQTIRKNAVRLLLTLHTAGITDRAKWASILDENFVYVWPITPFRSFSRGEITNNSRVITGIDAIIADACSFGLLAESIGFNSHIWKFAIKRGECFLGVYSMNKEDILASGDVIMCRYALSLEGTESYHDHCSCIQYGMLKCQFNEYNKIISAEIVFDVMGFMQQLQRVSLISPEHSIVPNTLDMALQPSREARAIIRADDQNATVYINECWTALTGIPQFEVEGRPFSEALPVHDSFQFQVKGLTYFALAGIPSSRIVIYQNNFLGNNDHELSWSSYSLGYLRALPLSSNSHHKVSHLLIILVPLPMQEDEIGALIAQHCDIVSPLVSSIHPKQCDAAKYAADFESEFSRQVEVYNQTYNKSANYTSICEDFQETLESNAIDNQSQSTKGNSLGTSGGSYVTTIGGSTSVSSTSYAAQENAISIGGNAGSVFLNHPRGLYNSDNKLGMQQIHVGDPHASLSHSAPDVHLSGQLLVPSMGSRGMINYSSSGLVTQPSQSGATQTPTVQFSVHPQAPQMANFRGVNPW